MVYRKEYAHGHVWETEKNLHTDMFKAEYRNRLNQGNMVVHPCTMPTTNSDIYNEASVMFYKLGSASTVVCITLDTTETTFN